MLCYCPLRHAQYADCQLYLQRAGAKHLMQALMATAEEKPLRVCHFFGMSLMVYESQFELSIRVDRVWEMFSE